MSKRKRKILILNLNKDEIKKYKKNREINEKKNNRVKNIF